MGQSRRNDRERPSSEIRDRSGRKVRKTRRAGVVRDFSKIAETRASRKLGEEIVLQLPVTEYRDPRGSRNDGGIKKRQQQIETLLFYETSEEDEATHVWNGVPREPVSLFPLRRKKVRRTRRARAKRRPIRNYGERGSSWRTRRTRRRKAEKPSVPRTRRTRVSRRMKGARAITLRRAVGRTNFPVCSSLPFFWFPLGRGVRRHSEERRNGTRDRKTRALHRKPDSP